MEQKFLHLKPTKSFMANKPSDIIFSDVAFSFFCKWMRQNPLLFDKIETLIKDCLRNPFNGLGKPEPLKGNYQGCWSRRINQEHRLIYYMNAEGLHIISCRNHYDD